MSSELAPEWLPGWVPPPPHDSLVFDDGEPMESDWHRDQMLLLIEQLKYWISARRDDFYIGGNQAIYFSSIQAKNRDFRGPDIFAVVGTDPRERDGWVVWEENNQVPDLVIELTSPSTEKADRGEKFRIYEQVLRVREYFICDPRHHTLEGWRNDPSGFVPIAANSEGRLQSVVAGACLGPWTGSYLRHEGSWVRLFDRSGNLVPTQEELALLGSQRAEAEAQRADAEAQRAEAEAQRAEAETQRAAALEARLAAYEARFGKLDDEP